MNILVCVFHKNVLYTLRTLKVCDMYHMGPFSDTFVAIYLFFKRLMLVAIHCHYMVKHKQYIFKIKKYYFVAQKERRDTALE